MNVLSRGFLIALEGIDGSGKSTLMHELAAYAQSRHIPVITTKEPGGTPLGIHLRQLVQMPTVTLSPQAEFLLFAADRAQHIAEVIRPALDARKLIFSDRMADSSLVYQGYGRGLSTSMINTINAFAMDTIKPDITIYVRVSSETAWERIIARKQELTAFEKEKRPFVERLINGFEELYQNRSDVIIVDGQVSQHVLAQTTWRTLLPYLPVSAHE